MASTSSGPLAGVRVLSLGGIGANPFANMMFADLGADVTLIERVDADGTSLAEVGGATFTRGQRSVRIDVRQPRGRDIVLRMAARSDVVTEGFRPGVTERLGLGPVDCMELNPRLVYGRLTGWGQSGPLALAAGHDINYIALSGLLSAIGRADSPPTPPLNLVGDIGGGALMLVAGVLAALVERERSGLGQVIDAAMVDGAALMGTGILALWATPYWEPHRGSNAFDGGAPFYDTYETADGRFVSIGALEPQFFALLLSLLDPESPRDFDQWDRSTWPQQRAYFTQTFRTRTRDEWCAVLEGTDACFAPVLEPSELDQHAHIRARATASRSTGRIVAEAAPRFSRTPGSRGELPATGQDTLDLLRDLGLEDPEIDELVADRVVR